MDDAGSGIEAVELGLEEGEIEIMATRRRRRPRRSPRTAGTDTRRPAGPPIRGAAGKRSRQTRAKPTRRNVAGHPRSAVRGRPVRRWSQRVTETSDALDLERNVFTLRSPAAVAASLKRSALRSKRRKAEPYQSAMSMLNFYINRAGRGLSAPQRRVLERAKGELRRAFGREPEPAAGRQRR